MNEPQLLTLLNIPQYSMIGFVHVTVQSKYFFHAFLSPHPIQKFSIHLFISNQTDILSLSNANQIYTPEA